MTDSLAKSPINSGCRKVLAVAVGKAVFPTVRVIVDRNVFSLRAGLRLGKTVGSDEAGDAGRGWTRAGRRINKAKHHLSVAIQSALVSDLAVRIGNELPLTDVIEA